MRRIEGSKNPRLIECINPIHDIWAIRWDVSPSEYGDENVVSYMEERFNHKPSIEEIKNTVFGWYNAQIDEEILSGMTYEGHQVWLSTENQFNYKTAYDLAVQTNGSTLPVTFKFGTDENPVYKEFTDLDSLTDFYLKAVSHVTSILSKGWITKGKVDYNAYNI